MSQPHWQGCLDVKYLSDRYNRGLAQVAEKVATLQRYQLVKDMDDGLPDFLHHMQATASSSPTDTLLDSM